MAFKYLLKKEFRQFLRDPGMPRMVMMFPILIVFVFPFAASMELRNIKLAVIDNDRSRESSLLVEKCANSGYFILQDICETPEKARSMMDNGASRQLSGNPSFRISEASGGRCPESILNMVAPSA